MKTQSKTFGIYTVEEETKPDGSWAGFRCGVALATGKQGKLYIKSDGREYYRAKSKDSEELEI